MESVTTPAFVVIMESVTNWYLTCGQAGSRGGCGCRARRLGRIAHPGSVISALAGRTLDALPQTPFRRVDAIAAGVSPGGLRELRTAGRLVQPLRGVLHRCDLPDTVETRAAAAKLAMPTGAALCRGTAAWLMGIDARPPGRHLVPPPLECCISRERHVVARTGLRCYETDLLPEDVLEIGGVPCTTPGRTAIDLARWLMPGMGLAVLDAMARRTLVDPAELSYLVERWRGDRYVAQARRLIGWCDPRSESYGESWLRLRFLDAGFPAPELQIPLTDDVGVELRRLDLGYRRYRYAWEYDGEEYHLGREAEAADRWRRADIERRWGWTVIGLGKNLVLGPSMALEYGVGEVLGMEPLLRRRLW